MKTSIKRRSVADQIREGLEEAIRHAHGEITLTTRTVALPDLPPDVRPNELIRLRLQYGMSQAVFARLLNVSTKTVQSWEQGVRKPSQAALRLIQIIRHDPKGVLQLVGMAPDPANGVSRARRTDTRGRKVKASRSGSRRATA